MWIRHIRLIGGRLVRTTPLQRPIDRDDADSADSHGNAASCNRPLVCSFDLNLGVEVRDTAFGIAPAALNQNVSLRPMNLNVTGRDRRD
jgi:hypothetical protein